MRRVSTKKSRKKSGRRLLEVDEQRSLLRIVVQSICDGLLGETPLPMALDTRSAAIIERRASFVTLKIDGALRGCMGTLLPSCPLALDVAHNALQAAFGDWRFEPLRDEELSSLDVQISVLSDLEPLEFTSEEDLLGRLRPFRDGLVLGDARQRGVFLPVVWEEFPRPRRFLDELKVKAGLPYDAWSNHWSVDRFTTQYFGGPIRDYLDQPVWPTAEPCLASTLSFGLRDMGIRDTNSTLNPLA